MSTFARIKRLLTDDGDGYRCLTCHERFERQYQVCPECGGYDIRRVEWIESETQASDRDM